MDDVENSVRANGKPVVAFVTNMLPPYRIGMFAAINRLVSFTVVLDTLSEFNRSWSVPSEGLGFSYVLQNCKSFVYKRFRKDVKYIEKRQFHFSERTVPILDSLKPECVVTIEFGLKTIWCLLYGWLREVPVILASEGTLHTEGHVGWFKRMVRRCLVSQCDRFWSNGPEATKLLLSYGADPGKVDEGMTGIDTLEWRDMVESQLSNREGVRSRWGLKGKVLLFSGSLTPRKGVIPLAMAVEEWLKRNPTAEITLLLLGDGEHRAWLEDWGRGCPRANLVMPGFVQRDELPPFFAAADWAVLPTLDDNWPLATLETTVAGLPQLFSCYNGATADLLDADTGVMIDPMLPESILSGLDAFYAAPEGRVKRGTVDRLSAYYSCSSQAERALRSFRLAISQN